MELRNPIGVKGLGVIVPITTLELTEELDSFFEPAQINDELALSLAADSRFEVEWPNPANEKRFRIRPKGWIGHFFIAGVLIVVSPKVPIRNVFGMLELAYDLKGFNLFDGATNVENLHDVFERVASILAKRVLDRARKGLYRAYIDHTADLPYRRGRIEVAESLRNANFGRAQLSCVFSEQTIDLPDNQILLWALFVAGQTCRSSAVKADISRAYRALNGYISLIPMAAADCLFRSYNRLNNDYAILHSLCRLIIDHACPAISRGQYQFVPFAIDMVRLFESFVAKWLDKHLPRNLLVKPQVGFKLRSNLSLRFEMDLVIYERKFMKALMVLDTKYKLAESPKEADIQQMVAYAVRANVDRAMLLYPKAWSRNAIIGVGSVSVTTSCFDISSDLNKSGSALIALIIDVLSHTEVPKLAEGMVSP
jgi:5-methylcytosine-specific restriction enzyme subunit McrC